MTTYIDLHSIGPDHETGKRRAKLLGLSGKLLPWEEKHSPLAYAYTGDTVICGPRALDYWRILPKDVALVCTEDLTAQDPLPLRYGNSLEWMLVGMGIPRTEATSLARHSPPKTSKHRRWRVYNDAQVAVKWWPWHTTNIPLMEELISDTRAEVEEIPYTYQLVDDSTIEACVSALRAWPSNVPVGLDVETDLAGDDPNEMKDTLVGVGVSLGNNAFYFPRKYLLVFWPLLDKVPWICHNLKYDVSVMVRSIWNDVQSAIKDTPAPVPESSGRKPLVPSPKGLSYITPMATISIIDWITLLLSQGAATLPFIGLGSVPGRSTVLSVSSAAQTSPPLDSTALTADQGAPNVGGRGQEGESYVEHAPSEEAETLPTVGLLTDTLPIGTSPGPSHGPPLRAVGDGALAAYLLGEPNAKLKDLVYRRLGYRMTTYDEVVGTGKRRVPISQVDPKIVVPYCCADAYFGVEIERLLRGELKGKALDLYLNIDLPIAQLLSDMQFEGVTFDRMSAAKTLGTVWREQKKIAAAVNGLAVFEGWSREDRTWVCKGCRNGKKKRLTCDICKGQGKYSAPQAISLGSSAQLVSFYHGHMGFPIQKISRETGKPSVDALALLRLSKRHVTIPLVLSWKRMQKHKEYLIQWLKASKADGKLHTTYSNIRVRSPRFSSEDPNLQQVKIDWRGDFQAPPCPTCNFDWYQPEGSASAGNLHRDRRPQEVDPHNHQLLVCADYAQVEVRVGAYASHDPEMLKVVQRDPETFEGNIHAQNVYKLFNVGYEDRKSSHYTALKTRAKNYFFGWMYGSKGDEVHEVIEKQMLEDPALAALGIPSLNEIRVGIRNISDIYGRYTYEWIPFELTKARDQGSIVYTIFGRPRLIPNLTSRDRQEREKAERECISHIIQGTATGDVPRMAMLRVKEIPGGQLAINAHDELVASVLESCAETYKRAMVSAMELGQPFEDVPLVVDATIGRTWRECHK